MMTRHRVLLVEDHALVRAGMRSLLETMPSVEVVGEAGDGNDALQLIAELEPEVVLMDISMPNLNGIEATRRAVKLKRPPHILVLSMHADREYVREALVAGAAGYLIKSASREELELAVAAVVRGEVWISPAVAQTVVDDVVRKVRSTDRKVPTALTPRQREVLQLIAEGNSTKQIARCLEVSVKTIETHRTQIMDRLDIHNVAGLVRYAIRAKIVVDAP